MFYPNNNDWWLDPSQGRFDIRVNGGPPIVTFSSVGLLGIGTATPATSLDVANNGAIRIGNAYISGGADLANFSANAWFSGSAWNIPIASKKSGVLQFDTTSPDTLYFFQSQTAGASDFVPRVAFASGGNVGVGTTNPAAKLEVSGGIKLANDAAACDASKAGTIRWTGSVFQGCTGTAWVALNYNAGNGTSQLTAGRSCETILNNGFSTGSGVYWIAPDLNTSNAFQVYCDMTNQGGGWTLVVGIDGANTNHITTAAVASGNLTSPTAKGKFSDQTINLIKLGASPAYRLTCATVTAYFQASCAFSATTDAAGACTAESYTYPPSSYGTAQYSQTNIVGLADGSSSSSNRLIYGDSAVPGPTGCETGTTGWAQSGTVYVR